MNPTGGHTTKLSPDATQTAIDAVAYEVYNQAGQPAELEATDATFFKQEDFTSNAHIWDEYSGIPNIEEAQEQEIVKTVDVFLGNQKTQKVKFFKNDYPISVEAFKTDKGYIRDRIGRDVADAVIRKQKYIAIIDCYGDAFDGNNFTTPDGNSLKVSDLIPQGILNNLRNCGEVLTMIIRSQVLNFLRKGSETIMQTSFMDGGIVRTAAIT